LYYFYNEMEITWQGGVSLLVASKWEKKEHDREGGTLPIVPKWKGRDGEGLCPSLSCRNESNDTRRRGHTPPLHVEMERTRRGGGMRPPPCRVKKETWTQQGGPAPSPSCWNGKNATKRGISLLVVSKRKRKHDGEDTRSPPSCSSGKNATRRAYASSSRQKGNENTNGEGTSPPRRVEVVRTRRGGAFPSLSRQKENENTTGRAGTLPVMFKWQERNEEGYAPPRCVKKDRRTRQGGHQPSPSCWSSKNATRRGIPLLVASKRIGEHTLPVVLK